MPVFIFTDIEKSTAQWEQFRGVMGPVLARHDEILRSTVKQYAGSVVKMTGDGLHAVFPDGGGDPLGCAITIQLLMQIEDWEKLSGGAMTELGVRVGIHAGPADTRGGDYYGPTVNRAARVMGTAHGGQIVVTQAAANASPLPAGADLRVLGTHMLKDLGEPLSLLQLVHPDLRRTEFPAILSISARPHNLPNQPTAFIGYAHELAQLQERLFNPACRLITLIGPGGIGKTRLALQSGGEAIDHFPHGAFLVRLAPFPPESWIEPAIADAIKLPLRDRQDNREQILQYLHDKTLLLILDNFEHLLKRAEIVSAILQRAPRVKILATSRERLNLRGEWLLEVRGLGQAGNSDEAFDLFADAAKRVKPEIDIGPEENTRIRDICRRLGGNPLAIELAAAWVRTLGLQEIGEELGKSLNLLTSAPRDVPDRHRGLRAVFESSWRLLEPGEQETLAALSVFRGGFSGEAAIMVAGCRLDQLLSLCDKFLVNHTPSGRYGLHVLIRQFAEERLSDDAARLRRVWSDYAVFYLGFLVNRLRKWAESGDLKAVAELEREQANLLHLIVVPHGKGKTGPNKNTIENALTPDSGDARTARTLLNYTSLMTMALSHGIKIEEEARKTWPKQTKSIPLKKFLGELSAAASAGRGLAEVHAWYPSLFNPLFVGVIRAAEKNGNLDQAMLWLGLGIHHAESLRGTAAMSTEWRKSEQALKHAIRAQHLTSQEGWRGYHAAEGAQSRGDLVMAKRYFEKSLALFKRLHDTFGMGYALFKLAEVALARTKPAEAEKLAQEALSMMSATGDQTGRAYCLMSLAEASLDTSQGGKTRPLLADALRIFVEGQSIDGIAWGKCVQARLDARDGRLDQATRLINEALEHYRKAGHTPGIRRAEAVSAGLKPVS